MLGLLFTIGLGLALVRYASVLISECINKTEYSRCKLGFSYHPVPLGESGFSVICTQGLFGFYRQQDITATRTVTATTMLVVK